MPFKNNVHQERWTSTDWTAK